MTRSSRPASRCIQFPIHILRTTLQSQNSMVLKPAIFLDRDGTINVEHGYITDPRSIELYPGVGQAIQILNSNGCLVVIISNQSAIGRHLLNEAQFERVNARLWDLLSQVGGYYDALYYCPHVPDASCECRKPMPGLILQAACDLGIDLASSFFIGDKISDIQAGAAAGCKTILVLTGKGKSSLDLLDKVNLEPDSVQNDLPGGLLHIIPLGFQTP